MDMNSCHLPCPGLSASWINSWMAAVGTTVLDSRIQLHWTEGPTPVAVLSAKKAHPVSFLAEAWPNRRELEELPIAEKWRGAGRLCRKVQAEDFANRAAAARSHPRSWALSSTMTDLSTDKKGEVAHGRFDPPGPGTTKWLHHRLLKVHEQANGNGEDRLLASFENKATRVKNFGLGFDQSRIGSLADSADNFVDPVVEVLAFFGLALFPVRGLGRVGNTDSVQRGWLKRPSGSGGGSLRNFLWPAWQNPLDCHGIDALLDAWTRSYGRRDWKQNWRLLGVHSGWRIVPYKQRGTADPTRGFGTDQL